MKWLADENFPIPAFHVLVKSGLDIQHIAFESPSISDVAVIEYAVLSQRIILTFDSDFGTLIFHKGYAPPGVVYFRIYDFTPDEPAKIFMQLLELPLTFEGNFITVEKEKIRQRTIPFKKL